MYLCMETAVCDAGQLLQMGRKWVNGARPSLLCISLTRSNEFTHFTAFMLPFPLGSWKDNKLFACLSAFVPRQSFLSPIFVLRPMRPLLVCGKVGNNLLRININLIGPPPPKGEMTGVILALYLLKWLKVRLGR